MNEKIKTIVSTLLLIKKSHFYEHKYNTRMEMLQFGTNLKIVTKNIICKNIC